MPYNECQQGFTCMCCSSELPPVILKVVPSFATALEYCNSPGVRQQLNSVWVMGGGMLYQVPWPCISYFILTFHKL